MEASAKNRYNVDKAFLELVRIIRYSPSWFDLGGGLKQRICSFPLDFIALIESHPLHFFFSVLVCFSATWK